jgi:hypothetical protein
MGCPFRTRRQLSPKIISLFAFKPLVVGLEVSFINIQAEETSKRKRTIKGYFIYKLYLRGNTQHALINNTLVSFTGCWLLPL